MIGASAGGIKAVEVILGGISPYFNLPIIIILHRLKNANSLLSEVIQFMTGLKVKEAEAGDKIERGKIYLAPPNQHLIIDKGDMITLNSEKEVNFSRPSIDITFSSAAKALKERAIGVVLSGANSDGANGLAEISKNGGVAIVQNPDEAKFKAMPRESLQSVPEAENKNLLEIAKLLNEFSSQNEPY